MENELKARFALPFAEVVSEVLKTIDGRERSAAIAEIPPEMTGSTSRIELELRSGKQIRFRIEFAEKESQYFAHALLGEAVADPQEQRSAVEELWRQIAGQATTALATVLRKSQLDVTTEKSWVPVKSLPIELRSEEQTLSFLLYFSKEAVDFLLAAADSPNLKQVQLEPSHTSNRNLDLLLDVPLSVTLRFGERRMPLREILELTSGAVIELDRKAEEPVELFLDEKVIARGSVVVVDGCYGLRVTEVCSRPQARISPGMPA